MAKKTIIKADEVQVIRKGQDAAVLTPETRTRVEGILGQVAADIGNAEIGQFFALRAGVGLIVVRELCERGEWGPEMVKCIPNRDPRTLRRYMSKARDFLENKALMARDIWDKLASVGAAELGGGDGRLMIGEGAKAGAGASKLPKEVLAVADYIREAQDSRAPGKGGAGEGDAKPRKITAAEKRKAASAFWNATANRIQFAGLTERLWEHLPDEELDSVSAALTTVASEMKKTLRARAK
jgi:hypothetical protein